jgi:hypothetical protein
VTIATHVHKVISEKIEVEVIKTIFHWHSTYKWERANLSPDCHCLLRIYFFNNETEAVVIASELYSNDANTDVYSGYQDLVKAVTHNYPQIGTILRNTIWLSHSGQFSVPLSWAESHQRQCFIEFSVQLESNIESLKAEDVRYVELSEVVKLLKGVNLEPAVEVLMQLEHDNNWGRGVVDQQQVKGCLELEEGIIEGKKRTKGLVGW